MDNPVNSPIAADGSNSTTYVYSCWPFGGLACGLCTVLFGVALLVQWAIPGSSELVWGVALVLAGALIMLRHSRRGSL